MSAKKYDMMKKGYIHSVETCGTVDGPGIRYVVFFQGCPLRCKYCHNPDTWKMKDGHEVTIEHLMKDVRKYKSYMKFSKGGITVTGGEPLIQHEFLIELFKACRSENIHTTLDTSGFANADVAGQVLEQADLVLLDIKSFDPATFKNVTGVEIDQTLAFLNLAKKRKVPVWIRFVLVPGLTDNLDDIKKMGEFLHQFENIERIEVLPFHKMGEYKWENLGYDYELTNTPSPDAALFEKACELLRLN